MKPLAIIAIGGNSLIKDQQHQQVEDQYDAVCETVKTIVDVIAMGYEVIITHGNGPQVGFIMRRSEIAEEVEHMHPVPLVNCDADTQGAIGYQIQQALQNEFHRRKMNKQSVTVVTQVEVDPNDEALLSPSKPIGSFYTQEQLRLIEEQHPSWQLVADANRGYRRVVPSPTPIRIIERDAIEVLYQQGFTVVAVGGGGIPVVRSEAGELIGLNAVIDKDKASSLLAILLKADVFIISTAVDEVCINYGKSNEKKLQTLTTSEALAYIQENQFAKGSMLPKIEAAIDYCKKTQGSAYITSPSLIPQALRGEAGTRISL